MSFYTAAHKCLAGFFRLIYRVKRTGIENEPTEGPVIVCANHLSDHDVIILAAALKRQVRYFAKAELFKIPVLKQLITALGAFPVERQNALATATSIKNTVQLLSEGQMVGIYPQGKRYIGIDPRATSVKGGVGLIAARTHAKVLPVCIRTKGWKVKLFKRTYVSIGKPIEFEELGITDGKGDEYQKAAELIFSRITEMIPEETNGN